MRRTGFGGSDAAATLGLNRYSSPYKLFCEKLGLIPDFVGNERTRWGSCSRTWSPTKRPDGSGPTPSLSPPPCTARRPGRRCSPTPTGSSSFPTARWPSWRWKTTDWRLADQWDEREGEAPVHHILQLMHRLAVTGLDRGHLVCLVGGNDLRMVEVHNQVIAEMVDGEQARWTGSVRETPRRPTRRRRPPRRSSPAIATPRTPPSSSPPMWHWCGPGERLSGPAQPSRAVRLIHWPRPLLPARWSPMPNESPRSSATSPRRSTRGEVGGRASPTAGTALRRADDNELPRSRLSKFRVRPDQLAEANLTGGSSRRRSCEDAPGASSRPRDVRSTGGQTRLP